MKITNEEFEKHQKQVESYFKHAMNKYQFIAMHLNDTRQSAVDPQIEAQADFDFAYKHLKKIVEQVGVMGVQLGLVKQGE